VPGNFATSIRAGLSRHVAQNRPTRLRIYDSAALSLPARAPSHETGIWAAMAALQRRHHRPRHCYEVEIKLLTAEDGVALRMEGLVSQSLSPCSSRSSNLGIIRGFRVVALAVGTLARWARWLQQKGASKLNPTARLALCGLPADRRKAATKHDTRQQRPECCRNISCATMKDEPAALVLVRHCGAQFPSH